MIALIAIISAGVLYFIVNSLNRAGMEQKRAQDTAQALAMAKQALIGYALSYRDTHPDEVFGYFPCPANESGGANDGVADTSAATCGAGTSGEAVVGLLPYRTLGLPDLRDEYGVCLWYAVSAPFNAQQKYDVLNWDTQGQFKIVAADGVTLRANPDDPLHPDGGAAVIIFAAGPPVSAVPDQTSRSGDTSAKRCGGDGQTQFSRYLESTDFPAGGHKTGVVTVTQGTVGSVTNNDRIEWITPKEIFDKIRKRSDFQGAAPAGHINALLTDLANNLAALPNPKATDAKISADAAAVDGILFGYVPAATAVGDPMKAPRDNWRNQFRYLACSAGAACLSCNGSAPNTYAGALIFTGQKANLYPRLTSDKADIAQYLDGDNLKAWGGSSTPANGSYIASKSVAHAPVGASGVYDSNLSHADLVVCIPPTASEVQGFSGFAPAVGATDLITPQISGTTPTEDTLTLNSPAAGPMSGCIWNGIALPMGSGIRLFFKFVLMANSTGNGFTLAVTDANANSTGNCGGTGADLGYAGTNPNAAILPIDYPKIAVEFDTQRDTSKNDPNANHAAIIYWGDIGTSASPIRSDDNQHGAGGHVESGYTSPVNPNGTPGRRQIRCLNSNTVCPTTMDRPFYVRLEIDRAYAGGSGTYTIRAYISTILHQDMDNLTADFATQDGYAGFAPTTTSGSDFLLTNTATIQDRDENEAFARFNVGFTTAQDTTAQNIVISNFKLTRK